MAHAIYTYPWNLTSAKLDQWAGELHELGATGVSLASSYHAGKFIHPKPADHRVAFPEDGAVYFRPRLDYGKLKPQVSQVTEKDDVLQALTARNDLSINAWTVLFHNTRLGILHPEATVKNAYGDSYPYSLCPVNPDVRDYGRTLSWDIAQHYPVAQLLLETPGFLTYNHGYHHEFAQLPPNPWLDAWLGLCFCDHCVAGATKAGVDALGLKRQAISGIDRFLASNSVPSVEMAQAWLQADLVQIPELVAFLRWRCEQVTSLVGEIVEGVSDKVQVRVIPTTQKPHATTFWEGSDLLALSNIAHGLELPLYQPSAEAVVSDAEDVIRRVGGVERLSAILRPGWPDMRSEAQVVDTVQQVKELGFNDIAFYNYDMLRPLHLRWLQGALSL